MADITLVKISALPAAEQIGAEDLLPVVQEGATKAIAYGVIKDDIAEELAPDATLSEAGKAADAKAVGDALALKADKTELTAEVSRIDAALNTKVNNTTYTAEVERINGAIETKADAAETTAALATKANANAVTEALALKADKTEVNAGLELKADKTELTAGLATKQDALTFDTTPTDGSTNPVTSGGVYTEFADLKNIILPQIENPYAVSDEGDGYFNTDGTIHAQTGSKEKYCNTYFPRVRNVPMRFVVYAKVPEGGSPWIRVINYDIDHNVIGNNTTSEIVGTTEDGYTIYQYASDNRSLSSSCAYCRVSYRSFGDAYAQYMYGYTNFAYSPNYKDVQASIDALKDSINEVGAPVYKYDNINIRSIAHRGWTENGEPENTFWSFKAAVNHNFPFIETDLAFTKDNVPVLLHDETINRTARNADGTEIAESIRINSITYSQALTYDFGIWKGTQYAGTKIPTLEDFLVFCRNTGTYPYIELKYRVGVSQANVNAVAVMLKKYSMIDCVTFISFDVVDFLAYVKNADETIRIGALLNAALSDAAERITALNALKTGKNRVFWDYAYTYFAQDESNIVSAAIENGVELETWTLGDPDKARNMNDYVTGVTSDGINFAELKRSKALT